MESLGVGRTSPPLPSLLHDQTQPGFFSREKEEAENKVWSPMASGELPHPSSPCCVTRLNQGYSFVRRKKQGTKFGVPGRLDNFPTSPLPAACPDSTRVILSCEGRSREQSLESLDVATTSPRLFSLLRDQTQPGLFFREKEESGNKVWSPWGRDNFPSPLLPAA